MNEFTKPELITNLNNSPLIATTRISNDRIYLTLANNHDRRNDISVNLTNGIMFIKHLQNGMYRDLAAQLEHLVNDINF